jgi:DNA ligase-1
MKNHHKILLVFSCFFLISAAPLEIQKANIYHQEIDISAYLISEKLDGIRARWDGEKLLSKNGNLIQAPIWFVKDFPKEELDGELWTRRAAFEEVSSIVLDEKPDEKLWKKVQFMVFDLPKSKKNFENRVKILQKIINDSGAVHLKLIEQFQLKNHQELIKKLEEVVENKGEGLMLHKKDSFYKNVRNDDLLKLKKFLDEEAVVVGIVDGKGKYQGKMGALLVEDSNKIRFKIGSGFSDFDRENPPKIGEIITYKFYGKTKNNIARFPVFLRVRKD